MITFYIQFEGKKNGTKTSILNINKGNYEGMKAMLAKGKCQIRLRGGYSRCSRRHLMGSFHCKGRAHHPRLTKQVKDKAHLHKDGQQIRKLV